MSTPTSVPNALGDGRATIEPGRLVAGRYLLVAPVGRGGSGSVWRAHDELLDRDVAIKRLHGARALDAQRARQIRDRAHREGRVAARLHHPRLAAIFDMTDLDGEVCLVMEFVAAPSLADLLDREGSLPPVRVAAIGAQIAEGLAAMHERGIVHRDVKPANIMIGAGDTVTVTDFGIAVVDTDPGTADHLVAGTPHYMAPELARGGPATAAADVFSLGATLYAALEGAPPAGDGGNALEVLSRVASGVVAPARRAGDLTPVLRVLLDHDPACRPDAARAARMLASHDPAPGAGTALGAVAPAAAVRSDLLGAGPATPEPSTPDPADDARTGPLALPGRAPAHRGATRAVTPVQTGPRRVTRIGRPRRRAAAVGAGLVGVLGAAGIVAAATGSSDPTPVAAPDTAAPAPMPVPVAAPPVIPPGPTTTPSRATRSATADDVEEVASSTRATPVRRSRDASAARAAAQWERWFERWRAQARANDDGDDDRARGRARGRDR
ncbi:serine/threonine-protein kinase [Actinomycetospora lutea]|uniref:serine/threonine-protein kinase n=1 Tax=Actinomycetospora lutea TaxID=663604 RepID=UPI002366FF21|nr:serine/threonine-protein kinase [Actinomycetospora lutea]MDD7942222.1 serine/threonine-protein kinase [Actinomycetospora lutea]